MNLARCQRKQIEIKRNFEERRDRKGVGRDEKERREAFG